MLAKCLLPLRKDYHDSELNTLSFYNIYIYIYRITQVQAEPIPFHEGHVPPSVGQQSYPTTMRETYSVVLPIAPNYYNFYGIYGIPKPLIFSYVLHRQPRQLPVAAKHYNFHWMPGRLIFLREGYMLQRAGKHYKF